MIKKFEKRIKINKVDTEIINQEFFCRSTMQRKKFPVGYGEKMFEDEDLKPLLQSGQVPTKPQLMRFIKKNPLPSGKTWLDLKYKFKTKIDNNKAKEDNKKNKSAKNLKNPKRKKNSSEEKEVASKKPKKK